MKKEKLNNIDKALIAVGIYLILFATASMIIYTVKGWNFDILITATLSGGGLEAIIGGFIQYGKYKYRKENNNDTGNDIEDN